MDFSTVKAVTIPEGNTIKIESDGVVLWSAGRLPVIYQEVGYIKAESGVGAYIDLGFAFDTKAKIEISLYMSDTDTTAYPFGATENSGNLRCCLSSPYPSAGKFYFYGSTGSHFDGISTVNSIIGAFNEYVFTLEPGKLHGINNTTGSEGLLTTQGEYTMVNHLYLFAQNYNGSPRFGEARQIRDFRYYDKNDELICDLVPCYRKSDGVIGMYDVARKVFLTNIGSGSFTKGSDV